MAGFVVFSFFEQFEANSAQNGKILRRVTYADSAIVFAQCELQYPVHAVFDAPVRPYNPTQRRRLGRQTADVIPALHAGCAGTVSPDDFTYRFNHDEAFQAAPMLVLFTEPGDVVDDQAAPGFDSSVIFLGLAMISLLLSAVRTTQCHAAHTAPCRGKINRAVLAIVRANASGKWQVLAQLIERSFCSTQQPSSR